MPDILTKVFTIDRYFLDALCKLSQEQEDISKEHIINVTFSFSETTGKKYLTLTYASKDEVYLVRNNLTFTRVYDIGTNSNN